MAIENAIAQFGMNAGQNIQNTVGNALLRAERNNRYQDQRNILMQDREREQAAARERAEQEFGQRWVKAYTSAPPEARQNVALGGYQYAVKQGFIDPSEIPGPPDDAMMQRLAGRFGGYDARSGNASIDEFNTLTQIANNPDKYPESTVRAAKIKLGIHPRAQGSSAITIMQQGLTEPVATSEAVIAGARSGASEAAKLGQQARMRPEMEREIAQAKEQGKATGEAAAGLPEAIAAGEYSLQLIDKAINHPGLDAATGTSSMADPRNIIPGTDAYDFNVLMDQLQGRTFLQAYESLKGGGQITEVEGKKAEQSIARLNKAQSKEEFVSALRELRSIIEVGMSRARQKAGGQPAANTAPPGGVKFMGFD